jgi:carboxyl-terminal processing protease
MSHNQQSIDKKLKRPLNQKTKKFFEILSISLINWTVFFIGLSFFNQFFYQNFNPFLTIIDSLINTYYIGPQPDKTNFQKGQLKGYVSALQDPYSTFLDHQEIQHLEDDLNQKYVGIGIKLIAENKLIKIIEVLPNSPAEKVGLMINDIILEIDGESVLGKPLEVISKKIIGEKNTKLKLTILRNTEKIVVDITRDLVQLPQIFFQQKETVGIIKINSFGNNIDQEMLMVANQISNSNIDKLILDLRDNNGGFLEGAIDVSSYFVPTNSVIAIEKTKTTEKIHLSKTKEINLLNYPLVILINQKTASAGEITASAIKENNSESILVGQTTFGKGVIQSVFKVKDIGYLKLTTAEWLTKQRKTINQLGIEPDIKLPDETDNLTLILQKFDWENKQFLD